MEIEPDRAVSYATRRYRVRIRTVVADEFAQCPKGGVIWLIVHVVKSRDRRHAAQARWHHALQVCSTNPEFKLGHVTNVVAAYPQRGTKAWIARLRAAQ